ncbi:carbohydrate ABC transporter permease [Lachnotalea sp. AF33-28]|uniref:carbohydrate ABC transporter permease n=1 Tax=Lachnotalea sp. AF33-28 TaxID=2292046 RepID=UPI0018F53DA8|nr:sugar ABC transporter permease [Lachnotalea sp. AF33-28]
MKEKNKLISKLMYGKGLFIFLCVVPTFLLFATFVLYPMLSSFAMSFTDWSGMGKNYKFIGLNNYRKLIGDRTVRIALKNNLILLVFVPLVTISLSLLFASLLSGKKIREKKLYRILFFFPNVIAISVTSILWSFIYHPSVGIINGFLKAVGADFLVHTWLGESGTVVLAIGVTMIWQAVGYYMILFIAAMEGVPVDLYEAADLEGAGTLQKFFRITLPLIRNVLNVAIIFNIIAVFNGSFTFTRIMTNGGPDNKSMVLSLYMYDQAFGNGNFGYAMAVGVVILCITLVLSLINNRLSGKNDITY